MASAEDGSANERRNYGSLSAPTSPNNWGLKAEDFRVPFSWEEKPGTPKRHNQLSPDSSSQQSDFDFSSRFSELDDPNPTSPTPANELFLNGQIRPLRPPPYLRGQALALFDSVPARCSPSPRSPLRGSPLRDAFCGLSDPSKHVLDPFILALEKAANDKDKRGHRHTRSLSPFRIFHWDEQPSQKSERVELVSKEHVSERKQLGVKNSKTWKLKRWLEYMRSGENRRKGSRNSPNKLEALESSEGGKKSVRHAWLTRLGFTSKSYRTMILVPDFTHN